MLNKNFQNMYEYAEKTWEKNWQHYRVEKKIKVEREGEDGRKR